jgi:hypothetical protein
MTNTGEIGKRGRLAFRIARWAVIAGLLILPWVAMRFTDEVQWTATDFVFAGVVLIGAGLVFELAALAVRDPQRRTVIGIGVIGLVLLIWVEAAVGIFH